MCIRKAEITNILTVSIPVNEVVLYNPRSKWIGRVRNVMPQFPNLVQILHKLVRERHNIAPQKSRRVPAFLVVRRGAQFYSSRGPSDYPSTTRPPFLQQNRGVLLQKISNNQKLQQKTSFCFNYIHFCQNEARGEALEAGLCGAGVLRPLISKV